MNTRDKASVDDSGSDSDVTTGSVVVDTDSNQPNKDIYQNRVAKFLSNFMQSKNPSTTKADDNNPNSSSSSNDNDDDDEISFMKRRNQIMNDTITTFGGILESAPTGIKISTTGNISTSLGL